MYVYVCVYVYVPVKEAIESCSDDFSSFVDIKVVANDGKRSSILVDDDDDDDDDDNMVVLMVVLIH